ncbi:MAG: fumarylacetoacetate hydrolase family protein, partial [Oceanobacter sp.]
MYTPLLNGQPFSHSVNKVVCVGRNYAEHALELNNPIPSEPLLFFKPGTSVVDIEPE